MFSIFLTWNTSSQKIVKGTYYEKRLSLLYFVFISPRKDSLSSPIDTAGLWSVLACHERQGGLPSKASSRLSESCVGKERFCVYWLGRRLT